MNHELTVDQAYDVLQSWVTTLANKVGNKADVKGVLMEEVMPALERLEYLIRREGK